MSDMQELFASGGVQPLNNTTIQEDAPKLVNRKLPYYENQQERPEHRLMLELAGKGYTVKEIAERTGRTAVCVNNILRQPALQQTLVNIVRKEVTEDERVVEVIRTNVVSAVEMLASVVKDTNARTADRISAAEKLLERRYGKANQPINRGTDVDLNSLSDAELAKMLPETQRTTTS